MSKNITISFDDNFNASKIDNNKKLILLLTTSKFTKTLEILLENKVNLNVLIDTTTDNGLVYNKEFIKMKHNDIIKKTMSKLYKILIDFHNDILYDNEIDMDKNSLDLILETINNDYNNFINNFINNYEFRQNIITDITNIYDINNTNTINYVEKYKEGY
jgi:phage anti-repressor protein